MSDQSSVARPYAQALFELAEQQGDLAGWGDQLDLVAAVASDPAMSGLSNSPHVSSDQLTELVLGVCGDKLGAEGQNLVKLLVRNGRLEALSDIAGQFAAKRAEAEKVIEAEMITATAIDENQRQQFADALQKKLGRSVKLDYTVDEDLIGGAVIRAGDWVVDGSVKAQLEQLVGALGS